MKNLLFYLASVLVFGYLVYAYVGTKPKSASVKTNVAQSTPKPVAKTPSSTEACSGPDVTHTQINNFVLSWEIAGVKDITMNPGNKSMPSSGSLTLADGDELTLSASCGTKTVEIQASRHGNSTNIVTNSKTS